LRYQIGDLVIKRLGKDFGVVIEVNKANSTSLKISQHSKNHLDNSSDIYYVFFPRGDDVGPYYTSDLHLKQSTNGITTY